MGKYDIVNNQSRHKTLLILFLAIINCASLYAQATVTINVDWRQWAQENLIQIRNAANTTLYQHCVPTRCFSTNGASLLNYTNSDNIVLDYGEYTLILADRFTDNWNGFGSNVTILVDGVQVLNATKPNDGNQFITVTFKVSDPSIPEDVPLTLFDQFDGNYDYTVAGGSFRTNSNDVDPCSIATTSSGSLTSPIPTGATIEKAYLMWAHSNPNIDTQVTFEGTPVTADISSQYIQGGVFYGMVSDVTSIVQGIASPSTNVYDLTDLTISTNEVYCTPNTVLGGWSLMVFYSDPTLPATSINLYNGFDGQSNNTTSYTLDNFYANAINGSKTTILSWEGDQSLANNEVLTVTNGLGLTFELTGDGDNDGTNIDNPFNSTIFDNTVIPNVNNTTSYGVDLDTYDLSAFIGIGESSITTNVQVGQDLVMLNSVILSVPSNLITGNVFEDTNYGGGIGRDRATASGTPVVGATLELYNNLNTLEQTVTTNASGNYTFGGMTNGDYKIRVVNSTVRSNRGGGAACTACFPVQTFRRNYGSGSYTDITQEIGGANPSQQDGGTGSITGAQTVSTITVADEGIIDIDFGFNFNTIVNTNSAGQGSLEQFIINSNALDNAGLDIDPNSIFDPVAGKDVSVFMIPPTADPLGRPADANFSGGYFDIFITGLGVDLSPIVDNDTSIDGRTQTAYSTDSNIGTIGAGGSSIGTTGFILPNFSLPEIQIHRNAGDVFVIQASNTTVRNLSIYANNNAGIRQDSGTNVLVTENLLGVNAAGIASGNIDQGFEITGGTSTISNNFISGNGAAGILVDGGTNTLIEQNHISNNGTTTCSNNIRLQSGSGITIQNNLLDNATGVGISGEGIGGNVSLTNNTITTSGTRAACTDKEGVLLGGDNSSITNNIIHTNGSTGVAITGTNSGNLISQNSIYNNGTVEDALGIDLYNPVIITNTKGNGVTTNDTGDGDTGPNGNLNFPVFESAAVSGNSLKVVGWARPGSIIELFLTDIDQGTAAEGDNQLGQTLDYGEGQVYLTTVIEGSGADLDTTSSGYAVDGNTDTTARFNFSITLANPLPAGSKITATATLSNSTSEFSSAYSLGVKSVITNRRITHRVKKD
ncbi:right-handed parallel beta-helix repeat-containing protein [Aquimarina sp. W85]|uniref:right-handed parallel beta-helix repeat-containing protein n=1 Tax=Aquimarina rhodophyticola TaxID=3342246 RepID=UPI00366DFB5C